MCNENEYIFINDLIAHYQLGYQLGERQFQRQATSNIFFLKKSFPQIIFYPNITNFVHQRERNQNSIYFLFHHVSNTTRGLYALLSLNLITVLECTCNVLSTDFCWIIQNTHINKNRQFLLLLLRYVLYLNSHKKCKSKRNSPIAILFFPFK